ncbi:Rieske 2Fe-2S domain-containing protein [Persicobacter diffluens]|uniref:Rieske domain-containing protein n=1 Tax=Persicobacter diffluens TaxID=981 RepID=A0AAN4VWL5_9BACT|nr:hypothetical protein PEDI_09130 [Persicobacter diffluens]
MGLNYQAVSWNRQKKRYDLVILLAVLVSLLSISLFQWWLHPDITTETLLLRATSVTAFLMLHFILSIGPLARLDSRFLPLLYNRRHLGVAMFIIAATHGLLALIQFHSLGDQPILTSLFLANPDYDSLKEFPFQVLGFFALIILFLMAASSHDFWLKVLSPRLWKALHMSVYMAYVLIVAHVALGALQYESQELLRYLLLFGFVFIAGLHFAAARASSREALTSSEWVKAVAVADLEEGCAKVVLVGQEEIAIFLNRGKVSAVNNQCKHQQGPIGEGQIINGCITCPWHGYQYLPENGQSPPPFKEQLKTYYLKLEQEEIWVNPHSPGEGVLIEPINLSKDG